MTTSIRAGIPENVVARQTSIETYGLRPASGIEILGIATATCLLAFFLCTMFCTILRISWCAYFPNSDACIAPHTTKISEKRGKVSRSIRKWSSTPLSRPRICYDRAADPSQTPYYTSSAYNTRIKTLGESYLSITQNGCAHIPTRYKLLLMPDSTTTSTRRQETTLDLEEGLSLKSNATAVATEDYDDFTRRNGAASHTEANLGEMNKAHFDSSFLPYRTASL
ncbi:hypothetical protein HD806DRAFT_542579 [Xylariaceae sp. AK1471]|nr:hypothetical protein HD806DRAFT_542579 [Xylariaceae sp. AK1471]